MTPIPRPIESAPFAPLRDAIAYVRWDQVERLSATDRHLARVRYRYRRTDTERTELHRPDLGALGHEIDDSAHCERCGVEFLALCAFRPRCGEA